MANTTTITGNLTREPEIRYTREGQATAQLGVAVNRRWQDRTTQEWQESTSFFDVICWRDLAENVALSLTKGMRVVVSTVLFSSATFPTIAARVIHIPSHGLPRNVPPMIPAASEKKPVCQCFQLPADASPAIVGRK